MKDRIKNIIMFIFLVFMILLVLKPVCSEATQAPSKYKNNLGNDNWNILSSKLGDEAGKASDYYFNDISPDDIIGKQIGCDSATGNTNQFCIDPNNLSNSGARFYTVRYIMDIFPSGEIQIYDSSVTAKPAKTYSSDVSWSKFTYPGAGEVEGCGSFAKSISYLAEQGDGQGVADMLSIFSYKDYYDFGIAVNVECVNKAIKNSSSNGETYRGRFILLDASDGAQDNVIYGAKEEASTGNLTIIKKDYDTGSNIKGAKFKIYGPDNDRKLAGECTTGNDGTVTVGDLEPGKYKIVETEAPTGYNLDLQVSENTTAEAEVPAGGTATATLKNRKFGDLTITKVDEKTNGHLKGIGFRIYYLEDGRKCYIDRYDPSGIENSNMGGIAITNHLYDNWYMRVKTDDNGEITYKDDDKGNYDGYYDSTAYNNDDKRCHVVFVTNDKGEIHLKNIPIKEYYIEEFEINPTYTEMWKYYEKEDITQTVNLSTTNNITIKNKQKYIDISGRVWVDAKQKNGKGYNGNSLYKNDGEDKDIDKKDVLVRLKRDGSTIAERRTGEDGTYLFESMGKYGSTGYDINGYKIKKDELGKYTVEFEYDGLTYEQVVLNNGKINGSKAKEPNRNNFNQKFSVIEGKEDGPNEGIAKDESNNINLEYENSKVKGIEPQAGAYNIQDDFKIKADTGTANLDLNNCIVSDNPWQSVKNVNLGLFEREQPDISLVKDLNNVKVDINGYSHIYKYGKRLGKAEEDEVDQNDPNPIGLQFKNKYSDTDTGEPTYSRAIYRSDYIYENDGNGELEVYATYQIRLVNESTNLKVKVNSILDYYDTKYYDDENENVFIGKRINDETYLVEDVISGITDVDEEDGYNAKIIPVNEEIEPQKWFDIYVQFKLSRKKVSELLESKGFGEGVELSNVAEINSYSVYYGESVGNTYNNYSFYKINNKDTTYAGIDKDSNPRSATPGNRDTYQDDADYAPTLNLLNATENRTISGTIFLDNSEFPDGKPENLHTNEERKGNGIYEESDEKVVKDVKVTMYKLNDDGELGERAKLYGEGPETDANIEKAENGNFEFKGYIPDKYILGYTWGDETYFIVSDTSKYTTVEDYKGTIWTKDKRDENAYEDNRWYQHENEKNARYSDAMEDYSKRQDIDGCNKEKSQIKSDTREIESYTPIMDLAIEKDDKINENAKTEEEVEKYSINNIDFGIVERPRQKIDIEKRVTHVKISLGNGQSIVDAEVVKENNTYKLNDEVKHVTYMAPISEDDTFDIGFLKAEIDNELIQDALVQITYEISVENNSEIDYSTENYYKYGEIDEEEKDEYIVKLKPTGVYDYLDSSMTIDPSPGKGENGWTLVEETDSYITTAEIEEKTALESFFESNEFIKDDGTIVEKEKWRNKKLTYKYAWNEWSRASEYNRTLKTDNKQVLKNTDLEIELAPVKPENRKTVNLYVSKELSTTGEIDLNNEAEIIEVMRTTETGRRVTPGSSILWDAGERVEIIPPTGEEKNYMPYIILGISSLVILGTGVVFIKKKILK